MSGQLVFNASVFPGQGDSIVYLRDVPSNYLDMRPGPNKEWDLRKMETSLYAARVFSKSDFYNKPERIGKVFTESGNELPLLFTKGPSGLEEIGFIFRSGGKNGREWPVYYDKSILIDAPSLSFEGKMYSRVKFSFVIERNDLPKNIQKDIPSAIRKIKIAGIKTLNRYCDSWGKLYLPGDSMIANRIRVTEHYEIDLYDTDSGKAIRFFDEKMLRELIPVKFSSNYFEFYSNKFPSATAKITIDQYGKITSAEYQSNQAITRESVNLSSKYSDFLLYPNPTYNVAKIYISHQDPGNYSIAIYNIIGKKLWERNIVVDDQTIIKENFGFLPKGTYLISLLDENGNILRTTRLIIISV